ncbi:MAG: class I SAM-dependent methyltransferase [Gammaproteobacteria bacterium]
MMKRLKRLQQVEVSLQIKDDTFIRPPTDQQRNWLVNSALNEFVFHLQKLDELAKGFAPGGDAGLATSDRTQAVLSDQEIMEDWQLPLMQEMAKAVTRSHGHVLEIGFGRGVSSAMIQDEGVRSHTIIECNDSIVQRFENWKKDYDGAEFNMVHGLWQDTLPELGKFDGVFFHTYPLNEDDLLQQIGQSVTFADHFFKHAADHLESGGVFTYLSNEIDSLSRTHQRLLFDHFSKIDLQVIRGLNIPDDVKDAWWSDSMVVVAATK